MRILHLLIYSPIGGIENYTRDLFAALEARGHENVVVYDGSPIAGLEQPARLVVHAPGLVGLSRSRGSQLVQRVSTLLREAPVDVAYVHTTINPCLAEEMLRAVPTVYFAHNYAAFCPSGALLYRRSDSACGLGGAPNPWCLLNAYLQRCNTRRPVRLWGMYRNARETGEWARRADAIICDSAYVAARHAEQGFAAGRMHVLPSPVPIPPELVTGRWPREPIILYVGRVAPQKGLDYVIGAVDKVHSPCTLVVAGDGQGLPRARALAERLGVDNRVSFMGPLDRPAVQDLYSRATVVVVPSVWPEPFGMVGPEAMSHGTPVVAFSVGGIPEWLEDDQTGYLVAPKDVDALAHRLELLLSDHVLARRLGTQGRQAAEERFGMSRHVDGLLHVFDEVRKLRAEMSDDTVASHCQAVEVHAAPGDTWE